MAIVKIRRQTTAAGRKFKSAFANMAKQEKPEMVGVGWWGDQIHKDSGTPLSSIAYAQEYGGIASGEGADGEELMIPPRPFRAPTIKRRKKAWANQIAKGIKREIRTGEGDLLDVLRMTAEGAEDDLIKTIESIFSPPLARMTIQIRRRNGNFSTKPLIDTGQFVNSVEARIL